MVQLHYPNVSPQLSSLSSKLHVSLTGAAASCTTLPYLFLGCLDSTTLDQSKTLRRTRCCAGIRVSLLSDIYWTENSNIYRRIHPHFSYVLIATLRLALESKNFIFYCHFFNTRAAGEVDRFCQTPPGFSL